MLEKSIHCSRGPRWWQTWIIPRRWFYDILFKHCWKGSHTENIITKRVLVRDLQSISPHSTVSTVYHAPRIWQQCFVTRMMQRLKYRIFSVALNRFTQNGYNGGLTSPTRSCCEPKHDNGPLLLSTYNRRIFAVTMLQAPKPTIPSAFVKINNTALK